MRIYLMPVSIEIRKGQYETRAVPLGPNTRMHWAKRAKWTTSWKEEVYSALLERCGARHLFPKNITKVHVILKAVQIMDQDNATASVKAIVDGLKGNVIADDSPRHIALEVSSQKVMHKKDEGVEIELA